MPAQQYNGPRGTVDAIQYTGDSDAIRKFIATKTELETSADVTDADVTVYNDRLRLTVPLNWWVTAYAIGKIRRVDPDEFATAFQLAPTS